MAVTAARVTVSNSAVALNTASNGGQRLTVQNQDGTNTVSLGPSGVTAANGYRLNVNEARVFELLPYEILFAIRDGAADVVVSVLRQGV